MNNAPYIDTDGFDWRLISAAWMVAAVVVTTTFGIWSFIA